MVDISTLSILSGEVIKKHLLVAVIVALAAFQERCAKCGGPVDMSAFHLTYLEDESVEEVAQG